MGTAAIRINGAAAGSNTDLPINTLVSLTNNDNTGVTTWTWALADKPVGSTAVLSSTSSATPTFTPDVEGSYLVRLTVNLGLAGENTNQVVAAVRQLKTRTRVPAAGESTEADAADGWAVSVDSLLQLVDTVRADPGRFVLLTSSGSEVASTLVRVNGSTTIKTGLPGQEYLGTVGLALGTTSSHLQASVFYLEARVDGGAFTGLAGQLVYCRLVGLIRNLTGAPAVGDLVYVSNAGILALAAGTKTRVVGTVIRVGGGTYDVWFDGSGARVVP